LELKKDRTIKKASIISGDHGIRCRAFQMEGKKKKPTFASVGGKKNCMSNQQGPWFERGTADHLAPLNLL